MSPKPFPVRGGQREEWVIMIRTAALRVVVAVALVSFAVQPQAIAAPSAWTERPPLQFARATHGGATVDGRILVFGGFNPAIPAPLDVLDSVESRRVKGSGTWRSVPPMPTARANPAAAELDGTAYVAGGFNSQDAELDVVERFDPRSGTWTSIRKLPFPRGAAAAASWGGKLYVAGGFVGVDKTTDSLIAYDPGKRSWQSLAPMPTSRARLRLVAAGDHLYAIGGQTAAGDTLSKVERYDPKSDTWTRVASMSKDRGVPGVVYLKHGSDRLIAVVGGAQTVGFEITGFLRSTEVYNLDTGRWKPLQAQLPRGKAGLVCALEADGTMLAIGGGVQVEGGLAATAEVFALKLTGHHGGGG
jgi:N-acetylneuraminic acid mutarotase